MDIVPWAVPAAVGVALAIGAARPLGRLLTEAGWAVPGAPGHLFAVAALLLLLGGLAQLLRSAGPVTASSAFWFWLLSAPVRRRDLLRRRYLVLLAVTAVLVCVLAGLVAYTGSVPVLPVVAAAALAAFALAGGAVCGQAWELADHVGQAVGQAMRAAGVLAFGSLATGVGRTGLNSALHAPPDAAVIVLAILAVAAVASCLLGYRALDRIDVSVLRRGQGLWTAGNAAAASMDVFMLTEFVADQRARQAGRVRPARMGAPFAGALARSEWARLRRRPYLAVRAAAAAVAWWGCRPVLHGPALAAVAVIAGYCLVLPVAGTLRQLTANPALRVQFAPRDRWLSLASLAVCLLASVTWTAIVGPGLGGGVTLAALLSVGLTAAVYRTVTRLPLDYSGPLVPTPFGDYPLDLWRQVFRGTLLLAVLIAVAAAITARLPVARRPPASRRSLNGKRVVPPGRAEKNRRMPDASIRPATLADADAIGLIHVRSWQSAYRGKMPQEDLDGLDPARRAEGWRRIMEETDPSRGGVLVAEAEGEGITGFASFGPSRDSDTDPQVTGEVFAIYADPAAWDTGIGRALMATAVAGLVRLGYANAILWVLDTNERARRFYALAGWEQDGANKTDGSRGFDITEVRYRRTLSRSV